MTVIVAVKKYDNVVIGADSFWGSSNYDSYSDKQKLIEFPQFTAAISGEGILVDVLLDMLDSNITYEITSRSQAREFVAEVFKNVKEDWNKASYPETNLKYCGLILATAKTIYSVDWSLQSFERNRVVSEGAGWSYALSAMHAVYDLPMDFSANDIAEIGLKTACKLSPVCKEPYVIKEVK